MATLVYVLHVVVFVYGAAGWMVPMPGPVVHLAFLLGVRYHWHVSGGCILTEWEKRFLGMPQNRIAISPGSSAKDGLSTHRR